MKCRRGKAFSRSTVNSGLRCEIMWPMIAISESVIKVLHNYRSNKPNDEMFTCMCVVQHTLTYSHFSLNSGGKLLYLPHLAVVPSFSAESNTWY